MNIYNLISFSFHFQLLASVDFLHSTDYSLPALLAPRYSKVVSRPRLGAFAFCLCRSLITTAHNIIKRVLILTLTLHYSIFRFSSGPF